MRPAVLRRHSSQIAGVLLRRAVPGAVLLGGAASYALARLGSLPPGHELRTTLVALPLVVAALWLLGRYAVACGARRKPPRFACFLQLALAGLIAAALLEPQLGLPLLPKLIAAGLLLLLALYLWRTLLDLRPLLGRQLPDWAPLPFLLLPLIAYLAVLPWSAGQREPDGDEPWYLILTHSLAYDRDGDLTNNYRDEDWQRFMSRPIGPQPGDPVGPHGELYSRHNQLLPLLLAPAYRLAGKYGALTVMALFSATLAYTVLRLARHYFPERPGEALAAYAMVAFFSPLLLYSHQIWVEVPAGLLAVVALDRIRSIAGQSSVRARDWIVCGACLLLLPLLKIRFALLAGPLFVLALLRTGPQGKRESRKALLALSLALGLLFVVVLLNNQRLFGNALKIHTLAELDLHERPVVAYVTSLLGLFWDCAFGLFAAAPIWMLAIPALLLLTTSRPASSPTSGAGGRALLLDLGLFAAPYLLVVASRREWYGGWSPPFRYALVILPLLGVALIPLLHRRRRAGARALLAALSGLTLALTLLWILVPGFTYNLANGSNHLLDGLETRTGLDLARFFPSSVRPRTATWLWPPSTVLAVSFLWWFPRRRLASAPVLGLAGLLLAVSLLLVAAERVPTARLELESAAVTKSGGHPEPEQWVFDRRRFDESWILREGDWLEAPVVRGASRVRLRLRARPIPNRPAALELEVEAAGRRLDVWRVEPPESWRTVELGPYDWPAGAHGLRLALRPAPSGATVNGLALDRIDFEWLGEEAP